MNCVMFYIALYTYHTYNVVNAYNYNARYMKFIKLNAY